MKWQVIVTLEYEKLSMLGLFTEINYFYDVHVIKLAHGFRVLLQVESIHMLSSFHLSYPIASIKIKSTNKPARFCGSPNISYEEETAVIAQRVPGESHPLVRYHHT